MPPRAAQLIGEYHVRYVFYGARVLPSVRRHLSLTHLLADPRLRLVYSSVATCRPSGHDRPLGCPSTGSYVFGIAAAPRPPGG